MGGIMQLSTKSEKSFSFFAMYGFKNILFTDEMVTF